MNKIAIARSLSSVRLGLAPAVYSAKANHYGGSEPPPYERSSVQPLTLPRSTAAEGASPLRTKDPLSTRFAG